MAARERIERKIAALEEYLAQESMPGCLRTRLEKQLQKLKDQITPK